MVGDLLVKKTLPNMFEPEDIKLKQVFEDKGNENTKAVIGSLAALLSNSDISTLDPQKQYVVKISKEMLDKINKLGIGPGGLGGTKTALAVNIETYPTHIAGLPVAINICCHVNRHAHRVL